MGGNRNIWEGKKELEKRKFIELANGIPSHDTFARVFAALDPQQFQQCFLSWIKSVATITEGEVIAIDGKQLRHSFDKKDGQSAISMVSAWATSNRLVLGQRQVDKKSLCYYGDTRVN